MPRIMVKVILQEHQYYHIINKHYLELIIINQENSYFT